MMFVLLAALAAASPPRNIELSEARCGFVVTSEGLGAPLIEAPDLHVLLQTAGKGAFSPAVPAGAAIVCDRSEIVPAANDWKVPYAGHPLFLANGAAPNERMGVLEMAGGSLRYRMVLGAWTPEEEIRIGARINDFRQRTQ